MKMSNTWNNKKIIDFINEIHLPELWNVETGLYKDRNVKKDGWAVVAEKFYVTSEVAYKKFRSLRTYAKNEERKKIKRGSAGGKAGKWFAFDAISFILTRDTPNTGLDSENSTDRVTEIVDIESSSDRNEEDSVTTDSVAEYRDPKPRASKRPRISDPILEKAQNIILGAGEKKANQYSAFGEHIANKLCQYDTYTRAQAEFKIMQILFDCDMGMYRRTQGSTSSDSRSGASTSHSHYSVHSMADQYQQNDSPEETELTRNSSYENLV